MYVYVSQVTSLLRFYTKILYTFITFPMRATCPHQLYSPWFACYNNIWWRAKITKDMDYAVTWVYELD
jgi:hypothetical protein